ncbi:uncharacterized protein LOC143632477 [Bidens hawaiensis]|uniref:uncharacterized protein LOC143632477 n=1 Tax=Bidens hawaiensis TaxID=980011 RepID=UPI00404948C3
MDESWRIRIRTPLPRSTEDTNGVRGHEPLDPNDFADVFGGPPRTLLSRQHSVDFATSSSLAFEDIPASEDELYSYIFGDSWKSRRSRSISQTNSNSKSNSSSILSSEGLSPFRPAVGDGDDLDKENIWASQELEKDASKQMELELLDEDIKSWSDGKESNIRLLLATLHHILCPSSGWIMIPLTNLKDSPDVKKAYQKARLCLHPDKLQQDSTISQKYVAEKAFPILQDAWAAFISQDVLLSIS